MYSLLKHSKQDLSGVAPLKSDGRTLSDDCEKSNALNRQFQSVFSPKSPERLSSLAHRKLQELNDQGCNLPFQSSPYSQMPEKQISVKGIGKLLKSLNPHKAAGSDQFYRLSMQKQMCLPFLKKETSQTLQIIARYHSHVFCAKCSNTKSHPTWPNIWLIPTYYLNCNTGSGRRGPARPSW